MAKFKVGDTIVLPDSSNWQKVQVYEDHVIVLEAKEKMDIGRKITAYNVYAYNRSEHPWMLSNESIVDKVLNKYL